jgi:hypothetical protein
MQRFYFDFQDSQEPDREGVVLGSLDEAISLAVSTVAVMNSRRKVPPRDGAVTIRVGHSDVAVVTLRIDVRLLGRARGAAPGRTRQ